MVGSGIFQIAQSHRNNLEGNISFGLKDSPFEKLETWLSFPKQVLKEQDLKLWFIAHE